MTGHLTLADELLLLALHDQKGSVIPAAAPTLQGSLAGALLMELTLRGHLRTEPDGSLTATGPGGPDRVHGEASERIARSSRPHDAGWWVRRIAGDVPDLTERLLAGLVAQGMVRQEERKLLFVLTRRSFPLADGEVEREVRDRIRTVVLDGVAPDERTAALLGLTRSCNLIDELFAPHERQMAHARVRELTEQDGLAAGTFGGGLQGALMGALMGATLGFALGSMLPDFGMDGGADAGAESETVATDSSWGDSGGDGGGGGGWD